MLDRLTIDDFRARLDEGFTIYPPNVGQIETILVEARDLGVIAPGGRRAFSLIFRGPREPVLPQRMYSIENAAMGRLEIFIVPVGPDANGMQYEAVFT